MYFTHTENKGLLSEINALKLTR